MKSTCVARAHPARHQATRDLIRQWRQTAEHLRVPLLFARDNPGCSDVLVRTAQWQWIQWWCRLHGWLKETLRMHIIDLFKTKKAHFIVEYIFYSNHWTFKYPMNWKTISRSFALINFKASATATFKLAHIKEYMAMPSTWNRTCFPNPPGYVSITIRTGRWVAFLLSVSWNWHLRTASGQRVRAYLVYFTQSWRSLPSMFVFGTIEDTPSIIRTGCKRGLGYVMEELMFRPSLVCI